MRKQIFVENNAAAGLMGLTKNQNFVIGLLVGQITEDRDFVVHFIPTPNQETDEVSDGEADTKSVTYQHIDDVDEEWVSQHAKQVSRLLPGGLDVIGIFHLSANPKCEARLRQILYSVYNILDRYDSLYGIGTESHNRTVVEICNVTKKINCRSYNVSDHKSNAELADWKVTTINQSQWIKLETKLHLDLTIPIAEDRTTLTLQKQIQSGISKYFDDVRNSIVVVDGKYFRDVDQPLVVHDKKSKTKNNSRTNNAKTLDVNILLQTETPHKENLSSSSMKRAGAVINVKGTIHVRAFVNDKCSVKYAQQAVKKDIMRSMLSRCEIHCEDYLVTDEEQSDKCGVHELPHRVFAPVFGTELSLCDYILRGDKPVDSLEMFSDILGLNPLEEDIEDDCELSSPVCSMDGGSLSGCSSSEEDLRNEQVVQTIKQYNDYLIPAITAGVGLVAAGVTYVCYGDLFAT